MSTKIEDNKWYTVKEAAEVTGISENTMMRRAVTNPEKWGFKPRKKYTMIWKVIGKRIKKWDKDGLNERVSSSK